MVLGAELNRADDDYPTFAKLVGDAIAAGRAERAVLICGSGAGVTVAANKLPGVRASIAHDTYTAHQMVEHDACNVMTLGARVIGVELAKACVQAFVGATFSGAERHRRRLSEVLEIERAQHPNPLAALHRAGQSIWLDNIRRALLETGTLARYISTLSVTGLTSNPTIFEHAIAGSADYDDAIVERLDRRLATPELFFELALEDIVAAAELFRPIFDATGGGDGFVSLEVSPTLADDTEGTIVEAKRLHAQAARPNVLIKVPGTRAGVVAIEELIFAGIPINVTLLFSREHYLAAAEAYQKGLERRITAGHSPEVASVASLFISRWDAASAREAAGELCATASASRSASARSRRIAICWQRTAGSVWRMPARARSVCCGRAPAPRTRPCRTLTTSPRWPPTAPSTPCPSRRCSRSATMALWGRCSPPTRPTPRRSSPALRRPGSMSMPWRASCRPRGANSFDDSFAKLLQSLEAKAASLREAHERGIEHLGPVAAAAEAAQADLAGRHATERIWSHDYTLWHRDPTEIANRLGWLVAPHQMEEHVEELAGFTKQLKADGFTHVLWSGMGGSSLFPQVLRQAFGVGRDGLDLRILDTSDPGTVHRYAEELPLNKTLVVVASKSGGTLEPRSHLAFFWDRIRRPEQFAVVTDPGTALDELATKERFRRVFRANPDLGGRYSALSHYGIVAAALLGVDIAELLRRAGAVIAAVGGCVPPAAIPASGSARCSGRRRRRPRQMHPGHAGRDLGVRHVARAADRRVHRQAGRRHPAGRGRGPRPAGGLWRRSHLREPRRGGRARPLIAAGQPVIELDYVDPFSIGAEVVRFEYAIAMAGAVLGINPFNQPNVEAAKQAAAKVLEEGMPDIPIEPAEAVLADGQAGRLHRDPGLHRHPSRPTSRRLRSPDGAARPLPGRDHGRDRPALPALDGPAAQGRRRERGVPPDGRRRSGRCRDSGQALRLLGAEAGAGRRRLSGAQGQGSPGRAGRP